MLNGEGRGVKTGYDGEAAEGVKTRVRREVGRGWTGRDLTGLGRMRREWRGVGCVGGRSGRGGGEWIW